MSSAGDPNIRIVLDAIYDDLVSGYDKAKQETNSLAASVNAAGRSMENSANSSKRFFSETQSGSTKLMQMSSNLKNFKTDMDEAGSGAAHLGGATATATREFRALFDEITAGRWHNVPGTMAILANRVFGVSGAALLAGVAVVGFVAGLVYLAYRAEAASMALLKLEDGARFAGNMNLTKVALQQTSEEIEKFGSLSSKTAEEIVGAWSSMGIQTKETLEGLSLATLDYVQATGDKAPEVVKKFTTLMENEKLTVAEVAKVFPGVTTAQAENFIATEKMGDAHKTAAALIQLTADRTKDLHSNIAELNAGTFASVGNFTRMTAAVIQDMTGGLIPLSHLLEDGIKLWDRFGDSIKGAVGWISKATAAIGITSATTDVHNNILAENTKRQHDQAEATAKAAGAAKGQADSSDQQLQSALRLGQGLESTSGHVKQLTGEINIWKAALAANPNGPAAAIDQLKDRIQAAQEQIDAIKQRGSRKAESALRQEGEMEIAQAKETISEINANEELGGKERVAEIQKVYQQLLDDGRLNARQRLQIEKDKNDALTAANKVTSAEALQIDKNNEATQLQIAKLGFQERRELLQEEVADHKITKAEELTQLKQVLLDEQTADLAAISLSEKGYADDAAFFHEQENRKLVIKATTAAAMAKIDVQLADADNTAARQSAEYYKKAFNEINAADDSLINNLTTGHMTLWASLGLALGEFIKKEIAADAQYFVAHLFYTQAELAADRTIGQQGLLLHLMSETAKTGATTAGVAARTSATVAGAAIGNTAEVASDKASILNSAFTAAANAYKSVMQSVPPPFNLVLAPVAAAGTFAAVAAYDTLTSLDVGAWNVPRNMPAFLHEGEQVVPKNYAQGFREAASSGAVPGSAQSGNVGEKHLHVNYQPNIQGHEKASLQQLVEKDSSYMVSWFHARIRDGDIKWQDFK